MPRTPYLLAALALLPAVLWSDLAMCQAVISKAGGGSGLKDVAGSETIRAADGSMLVLAVGEDLESGKPGTSMVLASAASIASISSNAVTLKFGDESTRSWTIVPGTLLCGDDGKKATLTDFKPGAVATVRWVASDTAAFKSAHPHVALSLRLGKMRYLVAEKGGRININNLPSLANNDCVGQRG